MGADRAWTWAESQRRKLQGEDEKGSHPPGPGFSPSFHKLLSLPLSSPVSPPSRSSPAWGWHEMPSESVSLAKSATSKYYEDPKPKLRTDSTPGLWADNQREKRKSLARGRNWEETPTRILQDNVKSELWRLNRNINIRQAHPKLKGRILHFTYPILQQCF